MIHFLYLITFALFVSVAFAALSSCNNRERVFYTLKTFAQFVGISLILAWIFYFLPW